LSKTIILLDGDVIAYRAAAAAEARTVEVKHNKTGRCKVFKTRTAFKAFLAEQKREYIPEQYTFTDIQTPEDVSHPLHTVKTQINAIVRNAEADQYQMFIGGPGNFRDSLPLPSKYKGNRTEMIRPIHLDACKSFAINHLGAKLTIGDEADDAIIYVGYEYLKKGYKVLLGTLDKDARAYSRLHYYDFTKESPEAILIPDLGNLEVIEKTKAKEVKGWGFLFFCHQMLIGDPTDNYKPTEIAGIKFGEMSSYKLLAECKTKQQAWNVVVEQYKKWYNKPFEYKCWEGNTYPATHLSMLQLYFQCVRMRENKDDLLNLEDFCEREGLKL